MVSSNRSKCVACRAVVGDLSRLACRNCEDEARSNLEALSGPSGLFARLVWAGSDILIPSARSRGGADPVVKSSKVEAPSPVRLQVMNLLGAGGVVHTLKRWAASWYGDLGFTQPEWRGQYHYMVMVDPNTGSQVHRPGQLDNVSKVLANNLPWAAEHRTDFDKFLGDLRRFVRDSKDALDPSGPRPVRIRIGRCPTEVGGVICGVQLMADPFASAIRCANCDTTWPRKDWPELSRTLRAV